MEDTKYITQPEIHHALPKTHWKSRKCCRKLDGDTQHIAV